jgi:methylglyoxal synthase
MPHDVDVKALMRLAIVYDVPMALNEKTAQILVRNLDEAGAGWKDSNEGA